MNRIVWWARELLFPRRCPVCDRPVKPAGGLACGSCRKEIRYVGQPRCLKCGKPLEGEEDEYCYDCGRKQHYYIAGRSLYEYHSMSASIYRFKYLGRREYAEFYGEELSRCLGDCIRAWKPDALIPVPIHASKRRSRGYNQAELLARELGVRLGIPVNTERIVRCRKTTPQKELDAGARQNNLKKAFKIGENDVKLNTVVIIDDIYTTGSTIDAVALELKKSGVGRIYFISLSIGAGL